MSDKIINLAVIGTGKIVFEFLESALSLKNKFCLKAVYSRTLDNGKRVANSFACSTVYTNINALANDENIDAVYIASPNSLHYTHAKLMLESKKHVLLEKPSVVYPPQLTELYAIADANKVILLENMMSAHFTENRKQIKGLINEIGNIKSVKLEYSQRSSRYQSYLNGDNPNVFNAEFAGGALMDLGVYCVYAAVDLFGKPQKIISKAVMNKTGTDNSFCANLFYSRFSVEISADKTKAQLTPSNITGEFGTVLIDLISIYSTPGDKNTVSVNLARRKAFINVAEDFYSLATFDKNVNDNYILWREQAMAVCEILSEIRKQCGHSFT